MSPAKSIISSFKTRLHLALISWLNTFCCSLRCPRVLPENISWLKSAWLHFLNWDWPKWVGSAKRCTFHIGWKDFIAWSIPSADLESPSVVAYFISIPWSASWLPISCPMSYSEKGWNTDILAVHSGCPPGHCTSIPFPLSQAPVQHSLFLKLAFFETFCPS